MEVTKETVPTQSQAKVKAQTKPPLKNQIGQYMNVRQELGKRLAEEATKDPTLNALFSLFALRERSRKQVTLRNISLVMLKEGFNFTRQDYERCFRFLASMGVGSLDLDLKGAVRSLKDVRFSLQQIGLVGLGRIAQTSPPAFTVRKTRKPYLPEPTKPVSPPDPVEDTIKGKYVAIKIQIYGKTIWLKKTHAEAAAYLISLIDEVSHGKD